ncbi:MAG: class I SAM-dependent methyltransferase [Candidatus Latescibacteria bacterium]|nr:class I SAM-dependent methyltransferase [Candidatus Latescibacterota bacterium]
MNRRATFSTGQDVSQIFSKNWLVHRITRRYIAGAVRYGRGRMLDVGCGGQPYRGLFAPAVSACVGLDRRGNPDVKGDAQALPFRAGAFDTILCGQVLEHLPEPGRAMAEMGRTLRTGGHLIVTAPHIWGIHEEPHDYYRFTRYGLCHLMRQAGLEVVEVRAMAGYWVTAGARFCYYLEVFERGLLKPLVRLGYGLVQGCALVLDRLHRVEGDTWNYLAVGRKPG